MLGPNNYTLTCRVFASGSLCPHITYRWTKNNGTLVQLEIETSTLSFSPLRLSDAGQYTCQATISTYYQRNDITVLVMGTQDIRLASESVGNMTIITFKVINFYSPSSHLYNSIQ